MFVLRIETDNAAFHEEVHDDYFDKDTAFSFTELANILQRVVDSVRSGNTDGKVHDTNGNSVGAWTLID